jgi:hypothetical protein
MRLSFAGLSIRGPLGSRLYFRSCPKPCGSRRRCQHRGNIPANPWATFLRSRGLNDLANRYERETAK